MYLGKKENCSLHLTLNNVLRFFHIIIMLKQECGMRNWEREGGWRKWEGIKCWRYRNHYSLYFKRDWVLYLKWFSRKENYLNFVCKSISNVSEYNCLSRSQWNAYFRPKKKWCCFHYVSGRTQEISSKSFFNAKFYCKASCLKSRQLHSRISTNEYHMLDSITSAAGWRILC